MMEEERQEKMADDRPAVIILNYNSFEDTVELIESIEEYDPGHCIIVVDNASAPEERQKLSAVEGRCITVLLEENGGYAAGNNAGIRKAAALGYDTFLLANSDTRLISRHAISRCHAYMKSHGIGILGPGMVNGSGKDVAGTIRVDRYGRTKHHPATEATECRSLTGAFLLIAGSVIREVGYLREFYFLYREDTDYCLRAYDKGIKILYYPEVTVLHKEGTTTKNVADYYYHRNMFLLSREIYGTGSTELAWFYLPGFIRCSLGIMKNETHRSRKALRLRQLWRAYRDGVRDIRGKNLYLDHSTGLFYKDRNPEG